MSTPTSEPVVGRLFYGVFWRIPLEPVKVPDEAQELLYKALQDLEGVEAEHDLADYIDVMAEHYDAQVTYMQQTYTLYIGHTITDISTSENKFEEMALLQVMDLDRGVLREDVKADVKAMIEAIPYSLREKFSRPGFYIAWGRT